MADQGDPVTYLMDPVKNKLVREEERGKGWKMEPRQL